MPVLPLPVSDELGPLISEHRSRTPSGWRILLLGLFCLLGGAVCAGLAVERWYFCFTHLGPAAVWRHSGGALIAGAILLLVGALLLRARFRPLRVEVHLDGLRWSRGRRASSARWSQVREIHMHATRYLIPALGKGTQAELVLGLRAPGTSAQDLRRLRLPHTLSDFDALTATVKTQVYPLLLSDMTRAFQLGRPLTFGRLHLTSAGMRHGRRTLAWPDLEQVSLEDGVLRLRASRSGGRGEIRLHAHTLPNLEVCLQLIDLLSRPS